MIAVFPEARATNGSRPQAVPYPYRCWYRKEYMRFATVGS